MRGRSILGCVLASLLLAGALASASGGCAEDLPPSLCGTGECGVDGRGGYCNVCTSMIPYGPHTPWEDNNGLWPDGQFPTTYCNEATRTCEVLAASCIDGWCRVPAGSYVAGAGVYPWSFYVKDQHLVVLSRPFAIMQTEVTQRHWMDLMAADEGPLPLVDCGDDCAATRLSFFDAALFANRLSARERRQACYELVDCGVPAAPASASGVDCAEARFAGPDCTGYRLPSEAEWELAAGAASVLCYSDGVPYGEPSCAAQDGPAEARGWYCGNSVSSDPGCQPLILQGDSQPVCRAVHPVGEKAPNRLGLYDVVGNAYELTGTRMTTDELDSWTDLKDRGSLGTITGIRDPKREPLRVDPGFSATIGLADSVVRKGGGYHTDSGATCSYARTIFRASYQPWSPSGTWKVDSVGFRLVRTLTAEEEASWLGTAPAGGE